MQMLKSKLYELEVRKRNEAFDLACYIKVGLLRLGADKVKDWSNPPHWALPLWENPEIISREERREMKAPRPARRS